MRSDNGCSQMREFITFNRTLKPVYYIHLNTETNLMHLLEHWKLFITFTWTLKPVYCIHLNTGTSLLHLIIHWNQLGGFTFIWTLKPVFTFTSTLKPIDDIHLNAKTNLLHLIEHWNQFLTFNWTLKQICYIHLITETWLRSLCIPPVSTVHHLRHPKACVNVTMGWYAWKSARKPLVHEICNYYYYGTCSFRKGRLTELRK